MDSYARLCLRAVLSPEVAKCVVASRLLCERFSAVVGGHVRFVGVFVAAEIRSIRAHPLLFCCAAAASQALMKTSKTASSVGG